MHWTSNHFDEDYLLLYKDQLSDERTIQEVDFLKKIFESHDVKTILDFPCGYGRHSLLMAESGYIVHGIDASSTMIGEALKEKNDLPNLSYEIADMRTYAAGKKYDAAVSLFTSLGYYEDASNEVIFKNFCQSVNDGGVLIIDIRNPIKAFQLFSNNNWYLEEVRNGVRISERLDPVTLRQTLTHTYDGKVKTATYRHYFLPELIRILSAYQCLVIDTFGDFDKTPYLDASKRLIVVAKKTRAQ